MKKQSSQPFPISQPEIKKTHSIANVVSELWERSAEYLTESELQWFADADEHARMHLQNLEEVIEGIGALICHDVTDGARIPAGALQTPATASTLMFFLAESLAHARALVSVSDEARLRLR